MVKSGCPLCIVYHVKSSKHIRNHIDQYRILSKFQHGVHHGQSYACETQLLVTVYDPNQHRDTNCQIDMAILDFGKAFSTAPCDMVLGKLQHYGIQGPLLD